MRAVIAAYQNACSDVIRRYEGHVAKFMGDGVLAYFGYPRAHEDDAERAVRAGLAVAEAVGRQSADGARLAVAGRHRHRAGRGRRPDRRGCGAGGGGGRRDAEPRGPAARPGRARQRGDRRSEPAAGRRSVRAGRPRRPRAAGLCRHGARLAGGRRQPGREPVRGAQRDRADAVRRPPARGRHAARPLRAGEGGRGPGRAAVRRAWDRQVAPRPWPDRAPRPRGRTPACGFIARPTTSTARSIR